MDSPSIPDELLLDIFLCLLDPSDLVRTSAACVSFCSLIADRSFLRRYRKIHAPPFLGFLSRRRQEKHPVFQPAEPPHPFASAASAVALAADFSLSFLPTCAHDWVIQDIRDGRVLVDRRWLEDHGDADWGRRTIAFWEIAVCDPLHRRYLVIPPFSEGLGATIVEDSVRKSEAFLIPSDDDEETSFRVMLMSQGKTKLFPFVFSTSTGEWRALSQHNWIDLFAGLLSSTENTLFYFRNYVYGCFYWVTSRSNWSEEMKMLVLDSRRMEFSIAEPPPEAKSCDGFDTSIAMVEAGEGRPGMFVLESSPLGKSLHYTIMQNNPGSSGQWQREKTISLSPDSWLAGSAETHLFLLQQVSSLEPSSFTLDIKTFQLERVCGPKFGLAYCNFPPSLLSSPMVSSDIQEGAEEEMLEQGVEVLRAEEPVDMDAAGCAGVSSIGDGAD